MNKTFNKINVLNWEDAIRRGLEPGLYTFEKTEIPLGKFTASLDYKIWAKNLLAISCYFTKVPNGKKFQLTVYCSFTTGLYKIAGSIVNFATCPVDCQYEIDVEVNSKNKLVLLKAILK